MQIAKRNLKIVILLVLVFSYFIFGLIGFTDQCFAQVTSSQSIVFKSLDTKTEKAESIQIPSMPIEQEDIAQGDINNIRFSDSKIVAWSHGTLDSMFFWTANPSGAIIWEQHLKTGVRAKLLSATRISKLIPNKYDYYKAQISSSKNCTGLVVWIPQPAVDAIPYFCVIDLRGQLRDQVYFRQLKSDFVVNKYCWSNIDEQLYVAPIPYSNPSNTFGLGMLSMNTGSFVGLVNRNQLDMIEAIYAYPDRNQVLVLAKAVNGKFDKDLKVVRINIENNQIDILGSIPELDYCVPSVDLSSFWTNQKADTELNSIVNRYITSLNFNQTVLQEIKMPGDCFNPKPSPDGKFITYTRNYRTWNTENPFDNSNDVWIRRLYDSAEFKIGGKATNGFWLPDSSAYYFYNDESGSFIRVNKPEKEPAFLK